MNKKDLLAYKPETKTVEVAGQSYTLKRLSFRERLHVQNLRTQWYETKDANQLANSMALLFAYSVIDDKDRRLFDPQQLEVIDTLNPDVVDAVAAEAYAFNWAKELELARQQEKQLKKALAMLKRHKR